MPVLSFLHSAWQGHLMHTRRTRAITEAVLIFLVVTALAIAAAVWWGGIPGAGATIGAVHAGRVRPGGLAVARDAARVGRVASVSVSGSTAVPASVSVSASGSASGSATVPACPCLGPCPRPYPCLRIDFLSRRHGGTEALIGPRHTCRMPFDQSATPCLRASVRDMPFTASASAAGSGAATESDSRDHSQFRITSIRSSTPTTPSPVSSPMQSSSIGQAPQRSRISSRSSRFTVPSRLMSACHETRGPK